MKRYIFNIVMLLVAISSFSCAEMMNDARDTEKVELIEVAYKVDIKDFTAADGNVAEAPADWYKNIKVTFNNFAEGLETVVSVDAEGVAKAELIPGIYNVMASTDKKQEHSHRKYIVNGLAQNVALTKDVTAITKENTISINPVMDSPLCIREMYYAGSEGGYFRDQFYEIYNNGDEVVYLDHFCLAHLVPEYATTSLPEWPAEDYDPKTGELKYAHAVTLWQIQGDGDDYPLAPGESVVLAQEAADHTKIETWAGFGLVDTSHADWECWAGNHDRVNPEVPDLPYVFWSGWIMTMQWLTSVDGSAMALYQPRQNLEFGSEYWQEGVTTSAQVGSSGQQYVRIPLADIYDAVECIPTSADMNMKRVPGILDSGATTVDGYYNGKSVSRKIDSYREDGTPIFQDTNNSSVDFEVCDAPMIRRHNVKQPAWGGPRTE
ncbi:MAG: DUF4876 domain-containing protein [Rikenellaceae bacterium]|nr:DUF4876 domain-containing protein [Rikenellaceae bacterium]